ncbi:MAG: DUF1467 family protein [Pseudomonadota bacterium]
MGIGTGIAIYFVIWWTTLFVTLPFKMRSQVELGHVVEGTEAAAPRTPNLGKRMLWNTVFAAVVFALYWFVFYFLDVSLTDLPELVPIPTFDG